MPCACGLIVHVHIDKCGGTTVEHALKTLASLGGWRFRQLRFDTYKLKSHSVFDLPVYRAINDSLHSMARPAIIASLHDGFPPLTQIAPLVEGWRRLLRRKGCRLHLVTALREPRERAVSLALWMMTRKLRHRWGAGFVRLPSHNVTDPALRRLALSLVREKPNGLVRYLTLGGTSESRTRNLPASRADQEVDTSHLAAGDWRQWPAAAWRPLNATYEAALLERATALLADFSVVGLVEDGFDSYARDVGSLFDDWHWAPCRADTWPDKVASVAECERALANATRSSTRGARQSGVCRSPWHAWRPFNATEVLRAQLARLRNVGNDSAQVHINVSTGGFMATLSAEEAAVLAAHNAADELLYRRYAGRRQRRLAARRSSSLMDVEQPPVGAQPPRRLTEGPHARAVPRKGGDAKCVRCPCGATCFPAQIS